MSVTKKSQRQSGQLGLITGKRGSPRQSDANEYITIESKDYVRYK